MSNSEEEEIARDYLCFSKPDVTVVIVDATCLERNLNLVYQTLEITSKVVVCVNLLDEAKKKGIIVDLDALSKHLGVPVVGTIARKPKTLKNLMSTIKKVCLDEYICMPHIIRYHPLIEDAISMLSSEIENIIPYKNEYLSRWICLKLLDYDETIIKSIEKNLCIDLHFNNSLNSKLVRSIFNAIFL